MGQLKTQNVVGGYNMTKMYSAYDIAKKKRVTPQAVYAAEKRGEIKADAITAGGRRLFSSETVENYLNRK
jgi:hypothetical protein